MKLLCCVSLLLGFGGGYPAWSQPARFDVREPGIAGDSASARQTSANTLVERRLANIEYFAAAEAATVPGLRMVHNRYGLPKLMLRDGRPLTAPSSLAPEEIARNFLRDRAAIFPLTASEVDGLRLALKDVTGAATFLAFNQTLNGIDVFNGQIRFTLSPSGEVVQAGAADIVPGVSLSTVPRLSAEAAVRAGFTAIGGQAPAALAPLAGPRSRTAFRNPLDESYSPISSELSIFPMTADSARLAYRVFLEADAEHWYEILIDAQDGSLLFRQNLYVSEAQARVWAQSPLGGARQLVPLSGTLGDPWLPANASATIGNNVEATVPTIDAQGGFAQSAAQIFDFPFGDGTVGLDPRGYSSAAATNLFYFVNLAHDYFYGLGFNERAGNFQTDNYGRGGAANDAVMAQAQYPGFTSDSRFAATPDGIAPRMRLGLYPGRGTSPGEMDAAYDGQTAIHEYAHGVSNRLVGAGTGTSCLAGVQPGALGEGWSDYFAISYFDNPVYGAYPSGNLTAGLRRQSYQGYTLTYGDLGKGAAGYEVHEDGEIWAATLWDLRQSLGRATADRLIVDGLKSTPCNPGMTDARDAILSADVATNGAANRAALWSVFARHGLGYSAAGADAAFDRPSAVPAATGSAAAEDTTRATLAPAATTALPRMGTLSHIAAGDSWDTAITLFNTSSTQLSVQLAFHADNGTALSLPLSVTQQGATQSVTGSTVSAVINPQSTLVVDAGSPSVALAVGWAEVLASSAAVSGFAIFRTQCATCTASEGTVPLQTQFQSSLIVPYNNTSGFVTGVALANLSTAQAAVTAAIWNANGSLLGTQTVTLPASGHTSFTMPSGLPATAGNSGVVQFQNPNGGALDGIGLRFSPFGTFTSVPTVLQSMQVPLGPQIASLSPTSGAQGATVSLSIAGTNLSGVTAVQFAPSTGISVSNVSATATQVTATLAIASGTTTGQISVSVTSPAGTSNALTFTVTAPAAAPQITSITPTSAAVGSGPFLFISGSNLMGLTSIQFSPSGGITATPQYQPTLFGTSTAANLIAMANIDANATPGPRNLTVTSPAGTSNAVVFTILGSTPQITSLSPTSGSLGSSVSLTVSGSNLSGVTSLNFSPSTGISVSSLNATASQVTAVVSIASYASTGAASVTVTSAAGTSNALTFTVSSATPHIASVSPTVLAAGSSVALTISGSNLSGTTGLVFSAPTGISVSNLTSTATQITATVSVSASATLGSLNVYATTSTGTSNTLAMKVTVPDGTWNGITSDGYPVSLTTSSGNVTAYSFGISFPNSLGSSCPSGVTVSSAALTSIAVSGSTFTFTSGAGTSFQMTATGNFSGTKVSGSVNWNLSLSGCSASAVTTWSASKQ